MKKTDGGYTSFWAYGRSILLDALLKEERASLAPLEEELKRTDQVARRKEIKIRIAEIKASFRQKKRNAQYSLFTKR